MRFVALLCLAVSAQASAPVVSAIVNAASYQTGGVAPGSIASAFGTGLSGGTVTVGGIAAPVIFASDGQINFQVPWEATAGAVVVTTSQGASVSYNLPLTVAPGIFTLDGTNAAMLIPATGQIRAAYVGEYITLYATGLGPVQNTPKTGSPSAENATAPVVAQVSATVGGQPATVGYAGLATPGPNPYYVGIYEVDIQMPTGVSGGSLPVVLTVGGAPSNTVAIKYADPPVIKGFTSSLLPLYKWLELASSGGLSVRAIMSVNTCPVTLVVDGKPTPMQVRAAAIPPLYSVTTCEAAIPAGAASVTLDGTALPFPKAAPQRFTVLGDTGCRMQTPMFQNCNVASDWPAAQIAASAAATKPDLFIHVGDYHYRESACPAGNAGCAGSPWGYNWAVWRDDVFEPLQATFSVAPWFLVRGNHESCARAGEGWFRFMDVRPYQSTCQVNTDPWSTTAGPLQLFHIDVAEADDVVISQTQVGILSGQFATVRAAASDNAWVLFHRPIWAVQPNGTNGNANLQMASANNIGGGIKMVLSGHIHFFETLEFQPDRAAQVVVGNSGDNLTAPNGSLAGVAVGAGTITRGTSLGGFGFTTMDLNADKGWTVVDRDVTGAPKTTCSFVGNKVGCDH